MSGYRHSALRWALLWLSINVVSSPTVGAQQHDHENPEHFAAIFRALGLTPGAVVADIGAGDGAYSSRLSAEVGGAGRVFAVDISPRALERLRARIERERLTNIDVIPGTIDDPKLPSATLDAALIVNAYHEMTEHQSMLAKIRAALKPTGRLVIVEPISESSRTLSREAQTKQHQIAAEWVQQEARAAGFAIVGFEDPFLGGHSHPGHTEWMLTLRPLPPAGGKLPAPLSPR
jgi:ubiquinone/menaquinone biosynthesis C-methylase UbiE